MRGVAKRITAAVIALAMIFTNFAGYVPSIDALAAETKTMAHIKAGSGNANGHFGSAAPEAFVLSDKADITDESMSFQIRVGSTKAETRFRFVTKYVDDTHWAYVAYDGATGWFTEFNNGGQTGWPSLTGLPHLNQNDFVDVSMAYEADGLHISVENKTTGESGTTVTNNANLIALKDQAGKVGFGAARFDTQLTDIYFADVVVGETAYDSYENWAVYKEGLAGQTWEPAVDVELPGEGGGEVDPPVDPIDPPVTGDGRAWWTLTGGSNNGGGHSYGNAGAKAPVLLLDNDKKMEDSGTLSLALKPSNNWGVFYTYVNDSNWLYVGYDSSSKWYYQYQHGNKGSYPGLKGLPDPVEGEELQMEVSLSNETLTVTVNGVTTRATNQDLIAFAKDNAGKGRFGVKTNGATTIRFADVTYNGKNCMEDSWVFAAERTGQVAEKTYEKLVPLTGTVRNAEGTPVENAVVRVGLNSAVTDAEGQYAFDALGIGTYNMAVTKAGYQAYSGEVTVEDRTDNVKDVVLELKAAMDLTKYDTIQSETMKAYIGKTFPLVARYEMLADTTGETYFRGNETELNAIEINGVSIVPEVTIAETTADSRTYAMHVEQDAINFDMKVKVSVEKNNLTWQVTEIKKADGCPKIAKIDIPQLNLLTVDAVETEAVFAGAQASTTTTSKADTYITFDDGFVPSDKDGYLYAFLSNGKLSAGIHSNSEVEGDKRVIRNNGADTISLTSAVWYYESGDKAGQASAANYADYPVSELPYAKVAVAGDLNEDGDIDWNDGAIAYRDIMNIPYGSEAIKDLVGYRIVMNFASMAPNPYLATADNIKKVYLATDGLPQAVMLKGYGNEGHDSANSEYADIAEREGGVEDFQDLIKIAHDYNTEIGIHVNAQEVYPEARSYNPLMAPNPGAYGWGWLDQSHTIDKLWDLSSQARWKRFVQLYDRINNTDHLDLDWEKGEYVKDSQGTVDVSKAELKKEAESLKDNMDFIYLDVWYQNSWETRRIAEEINSLGWRFSTEFSAQGEYDSTWQHWSTDAAYGGAGAKGFNSDIIRFIRNDQRDSQVLNYPSYGGTADNPLLGGFRLYGFEGWGGDRDYNNYIFQTFNQNLPTKFLQHYQVTDWESYAEGESPVGNTEKEITLKNGEDTVVVTRKEEQRNDDNIERIITLNGKKVLEDVTYLLPWTDNQDGTEKLYHWNLEGGTTTWELPADWKVANVVMYELSDQGRINKTTVAVDENGSVTLTAKAATAYVVVKGAGVKTLKNDFGECDYVKDPGFNGYAAGEQLSADRWTGDVKADSVVIEKSFTGDQRLAFNSPTEDVAVTTTISGLKPGTNYVAEVNVENDSDEKAFITVDAGETTVSNYTERSILNNYVKCDAKNGTKMQRMQISFTAESETAKLTLSRAAGAGSTYMDDIRIVEKTVDNFRADGSFVQDFESVVQGLYPFVLSSAQGISDPVTHLSQLNAPYTQKGYGNKATDDVITDNEAFPNSEWSLKHHGSNSGIIYQTLPQNFRFEPSKTYTVEFDYQTNTDKAYAMVVGNGTSYTAPAVNDRLAQATTTQHVTMTVTGDGNGQTWIGLYEDGSRANGSNNLGQNDFTLDNLVIKEVKDASAVTLEKTELYKGETAAIYAENADGITWTSSAPTVAKVEDGVVKALAAGTATLTATFGETTKTFEITVTDSVAATIPREEFSGISSTANTEEAGGEGPKSGYASAATDGDYSTFWHSNWSTTGFAVSPDHPAVLTVDLGKDMAIGGFRFLQRSGNGKVSQYSYRILDAEGNVLTSGNNISTTEPQWVVTQFDETVTARKIEISVERGQGGFASMCEVEPIKVEKVATGATLADKTIYAGETVTLEPTPTGGTMLKGLVWASSNEKVATVNKYGVVKAVGSGTTTITVTNAAGLSATCTVTVKGYADYKAVDAAIAKAGELVKDQYTDESWNALQAAINAVVRGKEDSEQAAVDEYASAIETAITNLVLKGNGATNKELYTVTVENGTGSGEYAYNESLTVRADVKDNQKFAGWEVDGKIVSLEEEYKFYVSGDMTITAIYDEAAKEEADAFVSNVIVTKRNDGKFDVKYVGQLVVPEGYKLIDAGLVWSSSADAELSLSNAKAKVTHVSKISNTYQFSVTIKGMPAGRFMRGKTFAKVVDTKGNTKVIYSEEKMAKSTQ